MEYTQCIYFSSNIDVIPQSTDTNESVVISISVFGKAAICYLYPNT